MIKKVKTLIIWSLVASFIGCNVWPFIVTDFFYIGEGVSKMLAALATMILAYPYEDKWLFRVSCIAFGLAILDTVKYLVILGFSPHDYEVSEYIVAAIIIGLCCIGMTRFRLLFFYISLNCLILLNRPNLCQRI